MTQELIKPAGGKNIADLINKEELARRLGKCVRTVTNWMQEGLLPYYRIGRSVRFQWEEVQEHLLKRCRVAARKKTGRLGERETVREGQ